MLTTGLLLEVNEMEKDYSAGEKWNMAMAYHQRIDNLLTTCTLSHMSGDGLTWYKAIFRLYIEIKPKMKPEEKVEAKNLIDELTKWKIGAVNKQKQIPTSLFVEVEDYMREILERRNMLTPKSEDLRGL